jgi:hypothetical protein
MADKIAKFKQALRAKKSNAKRPQTEEESMFEKEMQKYKLAKKQEPLKGQSPKQDQKNDRPSNKTVDTNSKTANCKPTGKGYAKNLPINELTCLSKC